MLDPEKTSDTWSSYGVSVVNIWEKIDCVITALCCIWYLLGLSWLISKIEMFLKCDNGAGRVYIFWDIIPSDCSMTTWWRHQMETFSALLAICAGNSPVPGEFPTQRPVTRSFDLFFDLRLNKRLSKQSWGWWFETLTWSLWRHCNKYIDFVMISALTAGFLISWAYLPSAPWPSFILLHRNIIILFSEVTV